jgi:hypothetical protein
MDASLRKMGDGPPLFRGTPAAKPAGWPTVSANVAAHAILGAMSAGSVLPADRVVHVDNGFTYVAPAAHATYAAPAARDPYIAPAGPGASETAIHGVGIAVNSHA